MDKRTLRAFALMALVIVVTPILFPGPKRAPVTPASDTSKPASQRPSTVEAPPTAATQPAPANAVAPNARPASADTVAVDAPTVRTTFSSAGAAPVSVQLK